MKNFQKTARRALIALLVEYGMTHDLTTGEIKAVQSIINDLEIREAGGYEKFRHILAEETS